MGEGTRRVLEFIRGRIEARGYPPTHREICEGCEIASTNGARYHLGILERMGLIERDAKVGRGIRLTPSGRAA